MVWLFEISPKKRASEFSHEEGEVIKIGVVLKKSECHYLPLANPSPYLSLCAVSACVLFIYTICISILCVSQEGVSLVESNQQICDFYRF